MGVDKQRTGRLLATTPNKAHARRDAHRHPRRGLYLFGFPPATHAEWVRALFTKPVYSPRSCQRGSSGAAPGAWHVSPSHMPVLRHGRSWFNRTTLVLACKPGRRGQDPAGLQSLVARWHSMLERRNITRCTQQCSGQHLRLVERPSARLGHELRRWLAGRVVRGHGLTVHLPRWRGGSAPLRRCKPLPAVPGT